MKRANRPPKRKYNPPRRDDRLTWEEYDRLILEYLVLLCEIKHRLLWLNRQRDWRRHPRPILRIPAHLAERLSLHRP